MIQAIEGCHFLQRHFERVEEAYQRGLRRLGLLHDNDASAPLGDVYTNPPRLDGLTLFGADVIKEGNRLGMLIDLAHANVQTTEAALKVGSTRKEWRPEAPLDAPYKGVLGTLLSGSPATGRLPGRNWRLCPA